MKKAAGRFLVYCVGLLYWANPAAADPLKGYVGNSYGRIGIRLSGNTVIHVYKHCPASGLVYKGDKVLEADSYKGSKYVDGLAGQEVLIKVERCGRILEFRITRTTRENVHD